MENGGRASTMAWGLAMALILATVHLVSTKDHIVGGNRGWNPGINYTNWVDNETFVVGDWISFRYSKYQYNVLQVNESGYDNCSTDNPIGNWSSGKDFIELNESKRYYFICGTGTCYSGMKLTLFVNKTAPAPAASPQTAEEDNRTRNNGWSIPVDNFLVLTVVLVVSALLV